MGQLRDRMEQDLKLKGVSPATIRNYLLYARKFAACSFAPRRVRRVFCAALGTSAASAPGRGKRRPTRIEGEGAGLLALSVGAAAPVASKPLDPVAAGYQYLCNYCRHAIHAAERRSQFQSPGETCGRWRTFLAK
jgi:hypothetical protein